MFSQARWSSSRLHRIAPQLKEALATYAQMAWKAQIDAGEALTTLEKVQVARDLLHPVDWSSYRTNALPLIPECLDHILGQEDGKRRYADAVLQATRAFALCGTLEEALKMSPEVAFHQAIRAPLIKSGAGDGKRKDVNHELQRLLSDAVVGEGVSDIFKLAGLDTPDISVLSDDFLAEVMKMPQRNLAVELLERLIKEEVKVSLKQTLLSNENY